MAKDYAEDFTTQELIACFIAHQVKDGERVACGAGLHVPRAGIILAHLLYGPNIKLYAAMVYTNLIKEQVIDPVYTVTDWRFAGRFAEAYAIHNEFWENIRYITDIFVVGAIQIDPFGNANLIGVGKDYNRLAFRGPGAVGTPTLGDNVDRYFLYLVSHDKRTLVEKCDFITAVGWGTGEKDYRDKLGLPGRGPQYCVTSLAIMDFDEETKRMRLKSVHPGVAVDEVVENTGFELIIPDKVPETERPTREEIECLRTRVDTKGMLRPEK